MSVQRYKATNGYGGDSDLVADGTGEIVLHSDYAALEARCAGMHKQLADVLEISTAVPFDRCILHAGERLAGRLMLDALQAKLAAASKIVCDEAMDHQAHGFCDCPLCKYAAILAGHAPATPQADQPHAVIHRAILDVIAATGAYLPPDGIDTQKCINRILQATDNAEVVSALNELERNPYKLPATKGGGDE